MWNIFQFGHSSNSVDNVDDSDSSSYINNSMSTNKR